MTAREKKLISFWRIMQEKELSFHIEFNIYYIFIHFSKNGIKLRIHRVHPDNRCNISCDRQDKAS